MGAQFVSRVTGIRAISAFKALTVLLIGIYLALVPVPRADNHLLSSDGGFYYSYLRSFVIDGDWNIDNDVALYNARIDEGKPGKLTVSYAFSIGPAVLWSPFFVAGHFIVLLLHSGGLTIPTDGYSYVEEAAISLGSIVYAVIGLCLLYLLLKKWFSPGVSLFTVLSLIGASSLIYYTVFEPSMSHALEFFTVSLFLWLSLTTKQGRSANPFLVGAAAGLMTIVRWQNAVLLLPLFIYFIDKTDLSARPIAAIVERLRTAIAIFLGALPLLMIQMYFWWSVFGQPVLVPQGAGFLGYFEPHLIEVTFSLRHGLFSWTPIVLFGVLGFFLFKDRRIAVVFATSFFLDLYVCSIAADWWGGDAYGMRRMIGFLPMAVLGLAAVLERLKGTRWNSLLKFTVVLLVFWNLLFVVQYRLGLVSHDAELTVQEMTLGKLTMPASVLQRLRK